MSVTIRGSGQTVLQVVSTTLSTSFSTASTSYADVTGLSATITPFSTTSKILVISCIGGATDTGYTGAQITRSGTAISVGSGGSQTNGTFTVSFYNNANTDSIRATSITVLDNPSSSSALTYQVQIRNINASTTYINRNVTNSQAGSSSITLLEISGS